MPEGTGSIWKQLGGTVLLAALLAWGFASSEALLPLRVVAEFPAEIGRALGAALSGGQVGWPRLMPASPRSVPQGDLGRLLTGALGIVAGLVASALLLWAARTAARARWASRGLGAILLIASLFPPYGVMESLPALAAGTVLLGLGALGTPGAAAQALLLGAVWSGLGPLWQMEGPLFRSGHPGPDLDWITQATGQPALIWSALGAGLCVLSWWWVLRTERPSAGAIAAPPAAVDPGSSG